MNSGSLSPPEAIVSLSMGFSRFSFTTSTWGGGLLREVVVFPWCIHMILLLYSVTVLDNMHIHVATYYDIVIQLYHYHSNMWILYSMFLTVIIGGL